MRRCYILGKIAVDCYKHCLWEGGIIQIKFDPICFKAHSTYVGVQVGVGGAGDGEVGVGDEADVLHHHLSSTPNLGGYNQGGLWRIDGMVIATQIFW